MKKIQTALCVLLLFICLEVPSFAAKHSSTKECSKKLKSQRSLNILLSGDDGLTPVWLELYDELVARGHNVWGYVTSTNVSGTGGGLIVRATSITQPDAINHPRVFVVFPENPARANFVGTAEAVTLGATQLAQEGIPLDLILFGPNVMEHLGGTELLEISGTMAGAVLGSSSWLPDPYLEVPAIGTAVPVISSLARRSYTVQVVANLVEYLDRRRGSDDRLLPKGVFLNVNVPSVNSENYIESCGTDVSEPLPKGVVLTKSGRYFNFTPIRQTDRGVLVMFPDHEVVSDTGLGPFLGVTNPLTDRDFSNPFVAEVVAADPYDANTPLTNSSEVAGKLVLVQAGGCLTSTKLQNVIDAGGIGMILVSTNALPGPVSPSYAVTEKIPSLTLGSAEGAQIKAQLDANITVTLTITDEEEEGEVLYFLGISKILIPEDELDLCPTSDTNAFREGYVTITPGFRDYTFSLNCKKVNELCCILTDALTNGPTICSRASKNRTSVILPSAVQTAKGQKQARANKKQTATDAAALRDELEKGYLHVPYVKKPSAKKAPERKK